MPFPFLRTTLIGGAALAALAATCAASAAPVANTQHVLLLSIDGLHEVDLARFVAEHPESALAGLAHHGVQYEIGRAHV